MKFIAKVCLALLLAITISFGGLSSPALAASSVGINANQSIDQILSNISFRERFNIVVINKTGEPLRRVGAYVNQGNWPLGDIEPNTATAERVDAGPNSYFSFAANYGTSDGKNFQFGASFPPIGRRKIGLTPINQTGNGSARAAWDQMSDSSEKAVNNGDYLARAYIAQLGGSTVWVYEVSKA